MKDNPDNSNDQIQNSKKRNSVKIPNSYNSTKVVNKQFTSEKSNKINEPNFIKRNSPIQPMPLFNLNMLKEESNNTLNTNSGMYFKDNSYKPYPTYSPLTPQLLPNDHKHYSKKNFPSKEEVCKGNPDYSQKLKIPSSSPITQYFNMDNIFNKDFGFQLESQTPNNFGETPISHLSNVSQSDMFNCSPSDFFNRGSNFEAGKNMKGINISDQDNEDDKNKNGKEEDELYTMKLDNVEENNNFEDDNNVILNRINELKNKKMKDKTKINNNTKQQKNLLNKKGNNNESKLMKLVQMSNEENNNTNINNKENHPNLNLNSINENNNKIEELNNNFELLGINNNEQINENKNVIKEENPSSILISPEIKKKFEDYIDDNCDSPLILNKEENDDLINNNKSYSNKNMNQNNSKFEYNNMNYNNNQMLNDFNNLQNNNDNLNYINNMNINCTNLNINNFTNLNKNPQESNFNDQNQQLLYYLQNQNYQNNFGNIGYNNNNNFHKNKKQKKHYQNNNNINNFQNDMFNDPQRMMYYNQMNSLNMNMNNNPYFPQNNMNNQGYPHFTNNNHQQNNNNNNNNNEYNKRKKIKKLDNNLYMDKPLSYLAKNLNLLGKDQGACRYLQNLLDDHPLETIQYLYDPLCENILQLITDQFGNYLIQKIILYLNEEQLFKIMQIISQNFFEICINTYGTRVLQKIIECLKTPKLSNYFFQLMKPLVTPLLKELNGTFVVQKFANIHKKYSNEINEIIVENSPVLSTNRHGCCVIQYYLDIKDPIMTPNLLDKLVENCLLLIIDQFGNYVIQSILLMGNKNYGNKLAEKISENVVYYAKHKYSSNVVEKCFDYCDGNYRMNLMVNVQKKENLIELILDEHGNYVVQKVLLLSPPATQKKMLKLIVPAFEKLKRFPYGERVINRLVASYPIITDKNFLSEIK